MCMRITNIFLSVVYLFSIFCLIFFNLTNVEAKKNSTEKSIVKNQNRDSRTLFCSKIISEANCLNFIFTCQIFTHNQWRVSSADSSMN